ncbi:hypothetical protein QW180_21950 [Vibrio sinaloensis]|nr:hypothetical protein [Vibrio sinaloensis]
MRASQEVRSAKLNEILAQSSWVIEGVYYKWLAPSFEDADVIIVLTTPLWKRQWRISKRFITRKFFSRAVSERDTEELYRTLEMESRFRSR